MTNGTLGSKFHLTTGQEFQPFDTKAYWLLDKKFSIVTKRIKHLSKTLYATVLEGDTQRLYMYDEQQRI